MKVLFCVVSYRSDEALERYLRSIQAAARQCTRNMSLRLVLIDNSEYESAELEAFRRRMLAVIPDAEIVAPPRNLGYFSALPVAQARCAEWAPDVVIYSNADLRLDSGFFSELIGRLPHPAAIIAPGFPLEEAHSYDQNPYFPRRCSGRHLRFLQAIYRSLALFTGYMWIGDLRVRIGVYLSRYSSRPPRPRNIYAPYGAMFIFSRPEFLLRLPPCGTFLYCEELYVGEEAIRQKESIYYLPEIKVFDSPHVSTGRLSMDRRRKFMRDGLDYILKRYY